MTVFEEPAVGPGALIQAIDAWLRGLPREEADKALLGIGLRAGDVGKARVRMESGKRPPVLQWRLTEEDFRHRFSSPGTLASLVEMGDAWRLAVQTDAIPSEIVERLLRVPQVASAFVEVERPAGSLRRRQWGWPYRIGLLGFTQAAAEEIVGEIGRIGMFPPTLLDVHRLEDEPGSVDVLVVNGPLDEATSALVRLKPVANAVLVLDRPAERWPLVDAELSVARSATSACASALATPRSLPGLLSSLVYESSHAKPFDVALTTASEGPVLLAAEPEAMARAALPEIAMGMAREASMAESALEPAAPPELAGAGDALRNAARGTFAGEAHEASTVAVVRDRVEAALDAVTQERWFQARVGTNGNNVVRRGENPVSVFIGEREDEALSAGVFDDAELPWEEERAEAFRLTVLFVPFAPAGEPQQAELDVPRFGRSLDVSFELTVPEDAGDEVTARIVLLFRNRVLQTAVLRGRVGETAQLEQRTAIFPSLEGLDDRRAFDVALLANETNGSGALITHSNGQTSVGDLPALKEFTGDIADQLAHAVRVKPTKKGLGTEKARTLLVELANLGRELFDVIAELIGPLSSASRIQLVTAHGGWFLPIELCYSRYAPDDNATICARYLEDPATCDGKCTPEDDPTSICPNAFWGLGKTIERQHFNPGLDAGGEPYLFISRDQPRRGRRDVVVKRVVLAASRRVNDADRAATAAALGAVQAKSWQDWQDKLRADDTQLLVLMPHTDFNKKTLEIANDPLRRSRIEKEQVTGAPARDVRPVVLLLGCRTTGTVDDPAGFSARFMLKGARVVFHSSTDLLNVHATEMARRLAGLLMAQDRQPELLSDLLVTFRRQAVRDGFVASFAISAYGDADWRI